MKLVILSLITEQLTVTEESSLASIVIDWASILLELFAAFLGFGLALLGERITDKINTHNAIKEQKKLLKEELEKVLNDLKAYNIETLDVQPIKTPVWDSAINTGHVSLFDFDTRNILFRTYNFINEFNSWCLIHTNYFFEKGDKNSMLIKEIGRIKNELLSDIQMAINLI